MPAPTQQQNAATFVNDMTAFAGLMKQALVLAVDLQARQTARAYLTTLSATATVTVNADGSVAATNDGTPNAAHPMVGLNISEASVNSLYAIGVGDFIAFWTGASAPAQNNRAAVANLFLP